ncbi:unnamed protein product [Rotaria socialis]|uniref:WxxW domain-containing protein n=1 Tax=Rotaria socialis TaxID=392032 RepID=A0A818IJ27_9BILA|nr:unnamed protein product [Rotaria socialis]
MLFTVFLLILFFNGISSQQGIFEPYTFGEGSCTGSYKWTTWYDTNDPSATQGDVEITNHIQKLFPTFMCLYPTAIEAQTSYGASPSTTGDVFRITVKDGFLCLNQQISNYRNRICNDYKITTYIGAAVCSNATEISAERVSNYCYYCSNCPRPFNPASPYVTTAPSNTGWCAMMSATSSPDGAYTRGVAQPGLCFSSGCSWKTVAGRRTWVCCCNNQDLCNAYVPLTCYHCLTCPRPFRSSSMYVTRVSSTTGWCAKMSSSSLPDEISTRGIAQPDPGSALQILMFQTFCITTSVGPNVFDVPAPGSGPKILGPDGLDQTLRIRISYCSGCHQVNTQIINDLVEVNIKIGNLLAVDRQTENVYPTCPIRSQRQKLRRADSGSLLVSISTNDSSFLNSDGLNNIDPSVLYPP